MRIGFTGTRYGLTVEQMESLADLFTLFVRQTGVAELHHGDCVGSDEQAHYLAQYFMVPVVVHPPLDSVLRAWCQGAGATRVTQAYLTRNQSIVDDTDVLIATPREFGPVPRSGTWATVGYARRIGRPVFIINPDGETSVEQSPGDMFTLESVSLELEACND